MRVPTSKEAKVTDIQFILKSLEYAHDWSLTVASNEVKYPSHMSKQEWQTALFGAHCKLTACLIGTHFGNAVFDQTLNWVSAYSEFIFIHQEEQQN